MIRPRGRDLRLSPAGKQSGMDGATGTGRARPRNAAGSRHQGTNPTPPGSCLPQRDTPEHSRARDRAAPPHRRAPPVIPRSQAQDRNIPGHALLASFGRGAPMGKRSAISSIGAPTSGCARSISRNPLRPGNCGRAPDRLPSALETWGAPESGGTHGANHQSRRDRPEPS